MCPSRLTAIGFSIILLMVSATACQAAPLASLSPMSTEPKQNKTPSSAPATQYYPTRTPATPPEPSSTAAGVYPILSALRRRRAIAHCTDRLSLVHRAYPWLDDPALLQRDTFLPHGHWSISAAIAPPVQGIPYDPAAGMALLEKAGWALPPGEIYRRDSAGESLTLALKTTDAELRQAWVAEFVEQMKACGIQIDPEHIPAVQFFGDGLSDLGELGRRDYDLAAFAQVSWPDPDLAERYRCESVPSAEDGWQGMNYAGWCSALADEAVAEIRSGLQFSGLASAYNTLNGAIAADLPELPVFSRVEVYATHPELQNFAPDPSQIIYTWNADQWRIPGKDTIVIGSRSEPAGLFPWDESFVNRLIQALLNGVDLTSIDYDYQERVLWQIPSLANGAAAVKTVDVVEGDEVVDAAGNPVEIAKGARLLDKDNQEVQFSGGSLKMSQLTSRFAYLPGLTWSDGAPVSKADYTLGYQIYCDPQTYGEFGYFPGLSRPAVCEMIQAVRFIDDRTYEVVWKPGFRRGCNGGCSYSLPPFSRLPAHYTLEDGRKLADVPAGEWGGLAEVYNGLPGMGPYTVSEWKYGEQLTLTANPYYYLGEPATPEIVIRFIPQGESAAQLSQGNIDLLGWDSITPAEVERLVTAEGEGKARVYTIPSATYELVVLRLK